MEKIYAPWTEEQVDGLNRFQRSGKFHPFTCGIAHGDFDPETMEPIKNAALQVNPEWHKSLDDVLVATPQGWKCPSCKYTQNWAHDAMVMPEDGTSSK